MTAALPVRTMTIDQAMVPAIFRTCLLVLLSAACAPDFAQAESASAPCADADRECARRAGRAHPVKKLAFWKQALDQPVARRIGPAPPELIDFLRLDTIEQGIPNKPRAPTFTPEFLGEVTAAFDELPQPVKHLLAHKLAGIYFIEDIGGTGFTDVVLDAGGNPVAGFVVLDPSVLLKQTANEWATWKENTPFMAQPAFRLLAEIETVAQNNRKNAIQYILLHELAHVISIGGNIHPSWNVEPRDVPSLSAYPFFQLSWTRSKDGSRYESLFDAAFPQRKDVVYYFGARLPAGQMLNTYENLERTNFATLYGATRPGDDFAEAFASYVHTVLMKRPFAIRIYRGATEVKVFGSCWNQPRCAGKKRLLEELLAAVAAQPVIAGLAGAATGNFGGVIGLRESGAGKLAKERAQADNVVSSSCDACWL